MTRKIKIGVVSLLLVLVVLVPAVAMAMSPEDQEAYNQWYSARFGILPGGTTAPSTGVPQIPSSQGKIQPAEPTAFEKQVVELLNQERVRRGLQPVQLDPYLVQAARIKGQDMVKYGYYGHQSPTYGYSSGLLSSLGIPYKQSRENLCVAGTPLMAHQSWMSSPSHRDNMLKPYWTHVGVGVVSRGTGSYLYGYYVVEIFVLR